MWFGPLVLGLAGCGLLLDPEPPLPPTGSGEVDAAVDAAFDASVPPVDADASSPPSDAASSDGGVDTLACPPGLWQPFAGPEELDVANGACASCDNRSPHLGPDGRTLWFVSFRSGLWQPYWSMRSAPGAPFGDAIPFAVTGEPFEWRDIAAAGRPLLRAAAGCADLEVWHPARSEWSAALFPNSAKNDYNGWISIDGLQIFFASTRDDGQAGCGTDEALFFTKRPTVTDVFGAAGRVDVRLPSAAGNPIALANPSLTADLRHLVFNAVTDTSPTRVYVASRASESDPFGIAAPVVFENAMLPPLEWPSVSYDGCEIFASIGGPGGVRKLVRFHQP